MKRLTIVVPYRAREEHLKAFVPALRTYFTRDKIDRDIPYRVIIVEQGDDLPFNRGALRNIGFLLTCAESDYVCFHDVDYLPIWADYRWSEVPMRIIWYGAEQRPIRLSGGPVLDNNQADFFGAVLLMPNAIFAKANGYANAYWGWGFEDEDLRRRFIVSDVDVSARDGTFQPLDHDNEGFQTDGSPTPVAVLNRTTLQSRWAAGADNLMQADGLNSVAFEVVNSVTIPNSPDTRPAVWEKVTVRLLMRPSGQ